MKSPEEEADFRWECVYAWVRATARGVVPIFTTFSFTVDGVPYNVAASKYVTVALEGERRYGIFPKAETELLAERIRLRPINVAVMRSSALVRFAISRKLPMPWVREIHGQRWEGSIKVGEPVERVLSRKTVFGIPTDDPAHPHLLSAEALRAAALSANTPEVAVYYHVGGSHHDAQQAIHRGLLTLRAPGYLAIVNPVLPDAGEGYMRNVKILSKGVPLLEGVPRAEYGSAGR